MATVLISGLAFGSALTLSGVHLPSTIVAQFKLEDWHMMKTFLTAVASSTVAISVLGGSGYIKATPRCYNSIGLFSYCDGNIIGGALLGIGMSLAGSCPGTVFAQIGTGTQSAYTTLGGALLGGVAWIGLFKPYFSQFCAKTDRKAPETLSIDEALSLNKSVAILAMETIIITAVGSLVLLSPARLDIKVPPITGGLLIGMAQLFSLLTRKTTVGVSSVYDELGNSFWWVVSGFHPDKKPASFNAAIFATGLTGGAWMMSTGFPSLTYAPGFPISSIHAFSGGFLLALGARMAGGCTSGHGISGISLLSTSSVITMGSAILAGILFSTFFL